MGGFDAVLRRYGKPAAVHGNGETRIGPAMVQPLLEKNEQWTPTPLGRKRQDRFLCLGAPELTLDGLETDGFLEWDGQAYNVVTAQRVELGNKPLYWWAILTVREDEA